MRHREETPAMPEGPIAMQSEPAFGWANEGTHDSEAFQRMLMAIEKGAPAIAILLVFASAGFVYLGHDLIFLIWALVALALHSIAFVIVRRASREGANIGELRKWNERVIAAHWLAGGAWALLAFLDCNSCSGAAFPFFKGAMITIALCFMALSASALGRSAWHVFMPAVIVLAAIAYQNRTAFDLGLAATLAVVMVFIAFFNSQTGAQAAALKQSEGEKDALAEELTQSLELAENAAASAEAASRAKSTFLATMSHDLRTPLNAIIGFSEIMKNEMMGPINNPRYRDYAGDIEHSGRHLLDMIDGVLDLSRLEAGGYRMQEQPLFLTDVIDAAMTMTGAQAAERGIVIRTDIAENMPPLMADQRALKQILVNLLSNAVKFSENNSEILVAAGWSESGSLMLAVRDHGCGMSTKALAEVTEAFARAEGSEHIEGFGLGLSIVKQLTEFHQGELILQSEPGKGTFAGVLFPESRMIDLPASSFLHDDDTGLTLPLSRELAMPFMPDSIDIEEGASKRGRNADRPARSGSDRLAAALKRRARKVANTDSKPAVVSDITADNFAADQLLLEAQLEAEIIGALENTRDNDSKQAANAA